MSGKAIQRPGLDQRLSEFEEALFSTSWIAERVLAGQQFNAYEKASSQADFDDDEFEGDVVEFSLCLGPINDARFICEVVGRSRAKLVEAALKVATEAFLARIADPGRATARHASAMSGSAQDAKRLDPEGTPARSGEAGDAQ